MIKSSKVFLIVKWDMTTDKGSPFRHGSIIFISDAIIIGEELLHINS